MSGTRATYNGHGEGYTQAQARRLFATHGFWLLEGLPERTQLSIDAHVDGFLTNSQFSGIKFLPSGWHCLAWHTPNTASVSTAEHGHEQEPSQIEPPTLAAHGAIRNATLRWFEPGEVVVRCLDPINQELVAPSAASSHRQGDQSRRRKRIRRNIKPNEPTGNMSMAVSPDVLKSIDGGMLAYPRKAWAKWTRATRHLSLRSGSLGRAVVARVVGVNPDTSDAEFDTLSSGRLEDSLIHGENDLADRFAQGGDMGREEGGKRIWGKSRREADELPSERFEILPEDDTVASFELHGAECDTGALQKRKRDAGDRGSSKTIPSSDTPSEDDRDDDESLHFTTFDLRRSWPPSAMGAELTRWSRDKSWLLENVIARALVAVDAKGQPSTCTPVSGQRSDGSAHEALLAEHELAFVTFVMSHNGYCWDRWKDTIALFCRSAARLGASSLWDLHPSVSTVALNKDVPAEAARAIAAVDLSAHTAFIETLQAQFDLLDDDFWSTQTSDADERWMRAELDSLRASIGRALATQAAVGTSGSGHLTVEAGQRLVTAWRNLSHLTRDKFSWQLDSKLDEEAEVEGDLEAEEGEDAPVVVEL
ncbi:hypothetical protein BCV70DRAFT_12744 [Testicularia cyperi]|uniref:Uncharacterized protein n=1 Tax=Testicularia cyperi TaxID=1882483 RepID=A0A317XYZ8_9BASI|nr:hypothetical protein BCV70DRAFT_12744 [Testicularia cyperi]